jgi:hypothetical protein
LRAHLAGLTDRATQRDLGPVMITRLVVKRGLG